MVNEINYFSNGCGQLLNAQPHFLPSSCIIPIAFECSRAIKEKKKQEKREEKEKKGACVGHSLHGWSLETVNGLLSREKEFYDIISVSYIFYFGYFL